MDADTAAAECEQLMRDTLRYDAEEVKGDKRCLVDGCIAQFRSEASRVNHIRVVHSMDVAKADMTRPKPMKDTCDELIKCPQCPPAETSEKQGSLLIRCDGKNNCVWISC